MILLRRRLNRRLLDKIIVTHFTHTTYCVIKAQVCGLNTYINARERACNFNNNKFVVLQIFILLCKYFLSCFLFVGIGERCLLWLSTSFVFGVMAFWRVIFHFFDIFSVSFSQHISYAMVLFNFFNSVLPTSRIFKIILLLIISLLFVLMFLLVFIYTLNEHSRTNTWHKFWHKFLEASTAVVKFCLVTSIFQWEPRLFLLLDSTSEVTWRFANHVVRHVQR